MTKKWEVAISLELSYPTVYVEVEADTEDEAWEKAEAVPFEELESLFEESGWEPSLVGEREVYDIKEVPA